MLFVPVISQRGKQLMPTIPSRARKWIKAKKATPFWKNGIFCVRLNQKPSNRKKQPIVIGIDSGIRKEAFTVKSKSHTYLNIQTDTIYWIKDRMRIRKILRSIRRNRKTPHKKRRKNRSCLKKKNRIPPSVRARFQWKLKILKMIQSIFPIDTIICEDISARCKNGNKNRRWNKSFSPLQTGKKWFYNQIPNLILKKGYHTKELRDRLGLIKSTNKLSNDFSAHCVDSWVLANSVVGGDIIDNKSILLMSPINMQRRRLHRLNPIKNGKRNNYGGTISLGFKKGAIIKHTRYGLVYVGGKARNRIVIHSLKDGTRLSRDINISDCKFICYNSVKFNFILERE